MLLRRRKLFCTLYTSWGSCSIWVSNGCGIVFRTLLQIHLKCMSHTPIFTISTMSSLCRLYGDNVSESPNTRGYISDNVAKVPSGFIISVDLEAYRICPCMSVKPFCSDHERSILLCTHLTFIFIFCFVCTYYLAALVFATRTSINGINKQTHVYHCWVQKEALADG